MPGGKIERGETPRQAAIREVQDEVGYRGRVIFLGRSTNDAWSDLERHHFLITLAVPAGKPQHDATEMIEPVEVSIPTPLRIIKQ